MAARFIQLQQRLDSSLRGRDGLSGYRQACLEYGLPNTSRAGVTARIDRKAAFQASPA